MNKKRILYIQHAGSRGGSAMSLLYTLRALDKSLFEPLVALIRPDPTLIDLYEREGFETFPWPGVVTFEHTTAHWCSPHNPLCWQHQYNLTTGYRSSMRRTAELIARVQPDLVHLNSVVLLPPADELRHSQVPFVWHVREHPVQGFTGMRTKLLSYALMHWPSEVIFLSTSDREGWVQSQRGKVVPNYIDVQRFDRRASRVQSRALLGLDQDAPVVLYLGGPGKIKGPHVLIPALAQLHKRFSGLCCLMPASLTVSTHRLTSRVARAVLPLLGSGSAAQLLDQSIRRYRLEQVCMKMGFEENIARLIVAADVLAFPAIDPHFARPVIEAAALGVPAVASDLPGARELIVPGETGLLVQPADPTPLALALEQLLVDPERRAYMGKNARQRALKKYDARVGVKVIEEVYRSCLGMS